MWLGRTVWIPPRYWQLIKGVRKVGLMAKRVITMRMCEQFGAFEQVTWEGTALTPIYALDAAYGGVGGDRCIGLPGQFGREANTGKVVIQIGTIRVVPVSATLPKLAEDQIAEFVREDCRRLNVPPENVFFDGRGTLMSSFARLWSPQVVPVEFGGTPTVRPVSLDHWILDDDGRRRLKRCDEEYSKFVTELWFSARYAVEAKQVRELPREIAEEGSKREWRSVARDRTEVETKAEMKERTNQSPDLFDTFVTLVEGARRRGFQISKLANAESEYDDQDWWATMRQKATKLWRGGSLNYKT